MEEGIPDFFIGDTPYQPRSVRIDEQYEKYGETGVRKSNRSNQLRKRLTLDLIEGDTILEIGSAEGWLTEELVRKAGTVFSGDIAMSYLRRAKAGGIGAGFLRMDAHTLPFGDALFDCVVLTEVLEHVFAPYRVLEEIFRVLKPDGILVLSTPNNLTPSQFMQHLFNREVPHQDAHLSFYDPFSLRRLLALAGFEVCSLRSTFFYIPPFKRLFAFSPIQKITQGLFRYFGDKILVKARKSDQDLWRTL